MPQNNAKTLLLLEVLRDETDARHRLSAPQLIKKLAERGVFTERRSVYRAIDALCANGACIEKTTTGYYYAPKAPAEDDLFAFATAVQAAWFLSEKRKDELLAALAQPLGRRAATGVFVACAASLTAQHEADDTLFMVMQTASRAIAAGRQLTLTVPGQAAQTRVNPYAMVAQGGSMWLICNVEGEDALTSVPLTTLEGAREETQPRRHFSQVSRYKTRFDAADALARLNAGAR